MAERPPAAFPDEAARRRDPFPGGTPVMLADGHEWSFARPRIVFRAADTEAGFLTCLELGDDGRYAALMAARAAAIEGDDDLGLIRAELAVGALLLRVNYDLSTEEVAALMPFSYADPTDRPPGSPEAIHSGVLEVARGFGPKR